MTVELASGSLFDSGAEALVNTVNCVGVMGKGVALEFKRRFPANFRAYAAACKRGEVGIGRMLVVSTLELSPRWIINFPTKQHWRNPSRTGWIYVGLLDMVWQVRARKITSIAIPALGCGNGGLNWSHVEPMIREAFYPLAHVRVLLYAPS